MTKIDAWSWLTAVGLFLIGSLWPETSVITFTGTLFLILVMLLKPFGKH